MAKAVLCPVCNGTGRYKGDKVDCHGCAGKGWVEVSDDATPPYKPYDPWKPWQPYKPYWYKEWYCGDQDFLQLKLDFDK